MAVYCWKTNFTLGSFLINFLGCRQAKDADQGGNDVSIKLVENLSKKMCMFKISTDRIQILDTSE